jgi:hypothetical protein
MLAVLKVATKFTDVIENFGHLPFFLSCQLRHLKRLSNFDNIKIGWILPYKVAAGPVAVRSSRPSGTVPKQQPPLHELFPHP